MDNQSSSGSLSSIRTFAKDMAKKRAQTETIPTTESKEKEVTVPTKIIKEGERHIYQAPSWIGNKTTPTTTKAEESIKPEEAAEGSGEVEQTLKPISAQKLDRKTIDVSSENTRPGIIITDSKKNRFRLFPAIAKSISQWFADLRQKQVAKKIPKYTVPETSHRKGVIQKATSKTGKFTSDDITTIQERIRLRKERALPQTSGTTWSANTEPGFPLLEAGEDKIKNIVVVPKKSFPATSEPKPVVSPPLPKPIVPPPEKVIAKPIPVVTFLDVPATPTKMVLPETKTLPTPEPVKPAPEKVIAQPTPVIAPTPAPAPKPVLPPPQIIEPEVIVERVVAAPISDERITRLKPGNFKEWLFSININTISMGVVGVVLAIATVSVISYYWVTNNLSNPTTNTEPTHQALLKAPLLLLYPSTLTKNSLFENVITSFKNTEGDVAQQIFVASPRGETLLKTETVINTLNFSLEPAFLKSISHIYFGGLRKSAPFILLDISDYTIGRGGMLNWETTIYEDISPLFNYNQLYDTGSIKTAVFTDNVISNSDVRVLRTLSGSELLVYGLINRNTVIITTNSSTFAEIITLLK